MYGIVIFFGLLGISYMISNYMVTKITNKSLRAHYVSMDSKELLQLPEDELMDAVMERIIVRYQKYKDENDKLKNMKKEERVAYLSYKYLSDQLSYSAKKSANTMDADVYGPYMEEVFNELEKKENIAHGIEITSDVAADCITEENVIHYIEEHFVKY